MTVSGDCRRVRAPGMSPGDDAIVAWQMPGKALIQGIFVVWTVPEPAR